MNTAQHALDGFNRISNYLNGQPPWKPVVLAIPGQLAQPGQRQVKSLAEILDAEARLITDPARGPDKAGDVVLNQ